jgi:two-component system OmpR family sensor kinase
MGRLFWKFFFFFWLAQVATAILVGAMIWSLRPAHLNEQPPPPFPHQPQPPNDLNRLPHSPPPPPPPHRMLLLPVGVGGGVSLLFAWLLASYVARPIRGLRAAFDSEARGDLGTRIGSAMGNRNDELADLGSDFDRMAERLQDLVNGQRRLLHDVSHELRSPLARLHAATGLLQQQPDRAPEFIDRIQRDTSRIDRLVGELLTLARLDSGIESISKEKFDLHDLIDEIGEDAQLEAEARQCTLSQSLPGALPVHGDVELLRRALENVLRNALRHAPAGSTVQVIANSSGGNVTVQIVDAGPGISNKDIESIFEPFFRAPNAKPFDGYGLGLTITRRVIKLHGGTVTAENREGGGFIVSLTLPLRV